MCGRGSLSGGEELVRLTGGSRLCKWSKFRAASLARAWDGLVRMRGRQGRYQAGEGMRMFTSKQSVPSSRLYEACRKQLQCGRVECVDRRKNKTRLSSFVDSCWCDGGLFLVVKAAKSWW